MNVIIHGEKACGKTRNADKFAAYFGCKTIIEMDQFHWSYQYGKTVDTLFLTNRHSILDKDLQSVGGAVVIHFDYAMTLIEQPEPQRRSPLKLDRPNAEPEAAPAIPGPNDPPTKGRGSLPGADERDPEKQEGKEMSHITEALKQSLSYFKALKLADGAAGVIDGQVQHLVNLCEKALAEPVKQEPEKNDWYIDAFLQVEVRLKKHFGVE